MPTWTLEQQKAINEDGTNILVSAGAGSGKTAVLSERVLRKLKEKNHIDNILVLTFTNAAAKEMKSRIRKKIAKENLVEELAKIDSSYITTFDSFALSVVKKYHYLLDLPKNIVIGDNSILLMKKKNILDNLFLKLYEENNISFLNLISDFCLKDDAEIKNFILASHSKLDLKYDKKAYLDNYINEYYNENNINLLIKKYLEYLEFLIIDINNNLTDIRLIDIDYFNSINKILTSLINSTNYLDIKFNSMCELPRLPKNSCEELKNKKESIKNNLDLIKKLCKYANEEEIKEDLLNTKNNVIEIIEIINQYDELISIQKRKDNLYEFVDIAKFAIKLVKENSEVKKYYQNKFVEIMIDEYQDTSDLQDLFINEIEHNNVYMVGDIKQSIYRFRNANPNLFKKKYEDYNGVNGIKIDLNKNFRSREEVLNNINLLFDYLMNSKIGGAEYRLSHRMIFGNNSYNEKGKFEHDNDFEILNYKIEEHFDYTKEEVEIFTIIKDIKEKINSKYLIYDKDKEEVRTCKYSDFVILLDRATSFNLYKKIFEFNNIPLNVFKDDSIKDVIDIKVIKNIIQLLIKINHREFDEGFKYSYMAIARSYLFRITDEEIFSTIKNHDFYNTNIYKKAKNISDTIYSDTINNILEKIIIDFGFYESLIKVGSASEHIAILDYLRKISTDLNALFDIEEFYDYLDNITLGNLDITINKINEDNNSVKIMTIHKSKGLEFPICYFAGLDKTFNISDLNEKFIFDNNYGFIIPSINNNKMNTIISKTLLKNNYIEEEISEKIRLFYVALTRAKEKIIFVGSLNNDEDFLNQSKLVVADSLRLKYRSFLNFLESIYKHINSHIKNVDLDKLNLTKDYNLSLTKKLNIEPGNKIICQNIKIESQEIGNLHFSKINHKLQSHEEKENMKIGLEIHSIMENFDFNKLDYSLVPAKNKKYVENFINSGILNDFINYFQEYEFVYEQENNLYHGIIDLIIEYDNYYLIVDYKLKNTIDDAYKKQLNGYKNYLQTITNKNIKICLYSFLEGTITYLEFK